jgi:quinol monooxygenase YgiN
MDTDRISFVCFITAKEETKLFVEDELKYIASMTQKEMGNINYCLHISADDDRVFIIYETWKSQTDLDKHMRQPYLAKFLNKATEWLAVPVEEKACRLLQELGS